MHDNKKRVRQVFVKALSMDAQGGWCLHVIQTIYFWGQRSSPGTTATSRSSAKSSSSVGGWCCRGHVDTAAVSCSSNKIHTWIRPEGGRGHSIKGNAHLERALGA